jgi:hypothetical protein
VNLAQLRTEVGRRAGIDADPVAVTQLLNDALATISADGPWPWMESKTTIPTVANQTDYTLPTSLLTVRTVLVDGREADPIALADADNYLNQDSPTLTFGTGDLYAVRNSTLIILPAPATSTRQPSRPWPGIRIRRFCRSRTTTSSRSWPPASCWSARRPTSAVGLWPSSPSSGSSTTTGRRPRRRLLSGRMAGLGCLACVPGRPGDEQDRPV